ncbi:flagellar brake protein [Marasmitruncus massiliensis]|uniref:flagellar brake protein n=1 Tax=Marasmitruncus massiliensis TaxID=1944642 RepID=UPI0015E124D1|nr:PilZ domain-containing protein [Marasmitruncus massiliensis]
MLPLPTEYISSVCEIKTLSNELVATGTIRKITEEYIEVSDKTGLMPIAAYGTEVKMNVFNSKSGFRVLAGKVYTSSLKSIRIMEVVSLLDLERRHFFRVEVNMSAYVVLLKKKNEEAEKEKTKEEPDKQKETPAAHVTIRNLSLGGTLFSSTENYESGDIISIRLKFDRNVFQFKGAVRRTGDTIHGQMLYGCEFMDVPKAAANALCAYIFQCQRQQIHKKRMEHQQL